jgi:hypothetical protein
MRALIVFAATSVLVTSAQARDVDVEPPTFWKSIQEKGIYERIWENLTFYENKDNDILESLSMVGRYQGQYWMVNAGQGNASGWENRRVFFGGEAEMFQHFTFQAQIKVNEDFHYFYEGLYQALVEWLPVDTFSLTVGRLDFLFAGLERSVSSTRIVTFERGLLVNQVMPGEVVGAVAEGTPGDFSYRAGIISGSIRDEFTDFSGGAGIFGGVGYKLPLFYEEGSLHLDYLFNNGAASNNALEPYDHVFSLWHQGKLGRFGLGVDLTGAHGLNGHPAVFGATVLPTYLLGQNLLRKGDVLQVALRYQFAVSDGGNGLELQQRYEQDVVPDGVGNRYHAIYGGLNYLLYGDRLKLMTGVEYSAMHSTANESGQFHGWTWFTGVRLFF